MNITGYPRMVSNAELERLYEEECSRAWDNQQPEIPQMRVLNEEERVEAFAACDIAASCVEHTLSWIAETISRVEGTAEADKLAGMYDQLSDFKIDLNKIKKGWEK